MKKIIALSFVVIFSVIAFGFNQAEAVVKVKGYYKPSTGRYVAPSYRTSPNKTKIDNYSTKGNYNTYSGKKGTVNPYKW